jgi:putative glutamine amidotransferase
LSNKGDRPIVAVTSNTLENAEEPASGVERAGGEPWVVLAEHGLAPGEVLDRAAALVLLGGEDVHPSRYGESSDASGGLELNERRDEMEVALGRAALDANMPIYGIGGGMHVLNAVLGGKPSRAVEGHAGEDGGGANDPAYHRIYISPGSKLAAVVGSGGFVRVNSTHRLGVRDAQKSAALLASAYSLEDGVIEALESPTHRWVIGVQFHPERRMEVPPHFDRLFQSLVERGAERLLTVRKR